MQFQTGTHLLLRFHDVVTAAAVWSLHLLLTCSAGAALQSGVYQTLPGATVEERGDAVPNGSRIVPISATLTFDLSASPPSLTAVISNAVLEGGEPFALTVRSSSGSQLMDGTYNFSGDYLLDLYPSGTQYAFDWKFSGSTNGEVVWNGITGWTGGHIWYVTISNITIVPASVQRGPASGLYRIVSGSYIECCGLAGARHSPLPNVTQRFVRLTVDSQSNFASMAFLAPDAQTVFSRTPCGLSQPLSFSFNFGFAISNSIFFHVDPGPPPNHAYWIYTVSNSANGLRIDGTAGIAPSICADDVTQFTHSNVVAVLLPVPRIRLSEFSEEGALLFVQGQAGRTNVIQASTDLVSWVPISTNVMPHTLCPICPYILFRDAASTNLVRRFYRGFEVP